MNHGVSELKGFGSSLSSGLDVDGNQYNGEQLVLC